MQKELHHFKYYRGLTKQYTDSDKVPFYRHNHLIEHLVWDVISSEEPLCYMHYELKLIHRLLLKGKRRFVIAHRLRYQPNRYYTYEYNFVFPDKTKIKRIINNIKIALAISNSKRKDYLNFEYKHFAKNHLKTLKYNHI